MALEYEDNQAGISKDDFLDSLISEIDGLLEQDGGLDKFQHQFDNFCFMVESYATELDKYRQAAQNRFYDFADKNPEAHKLLEGIDQLLLNEQLERIAKVHQLYINQCLTPPTENPTWVLHSVLNDYIVENDWASRAPFVYRPPLLELPINPAFWFFSEMDKHLSNSDQTKPPNGKELLMCDFARLAVIHDESCDYNKSIMIYKDKKYNGNFKRDDFAKDLWEAYKNPKKDNFIRTHKRILQQALNHVKSNLVRPQINIDFKNNFIKATIKHLPYFGPYLFDLIYGVDGVKTQKKENESNAISEKQRVRPKVKRESAETEQESLQEIIEVLKNWQKSKKTVKDFETAESVLPPIAKTYDILCRSRKQCGAKTTNIIRWLGSAANDGSGYYPALLEKFSSPEVIADLEKWQEKPAEIEQGNKGTKREREVFLEPKPPEILAKIFWIWKYGRQHWKLVCVGILVLFISGMFALPKFNLFGNKYQGTHLETENTLHKPIVVASATVEVKITSDWDFNGRVANTKAYLAFVKGNKPLLITSSIGYTASQTGNDEVVYKAKLDMDSKDSAVGNAVFFLKDAEYIQIEFGRMPSDSCVLEGDAICIINNSVRLEFSIPPQKLVNNRIFIRNLSESLRVLNEPGN